MTNEIRCSIECRDDPEFESPGRLHGVLLTYGERAHDRPEVFERGSLEWPSNGIVLRRQHQRGQPIARVIPEVRGNQVMIDQALPNTSAGRDCAAEIKAGLLPGLSIEFRATKQNMVGGVRRIAGALLTGAGLVDTPAYVGSTAEVRHHEGRRRLWL